MRADSGEHRGWRRQRVRLFRKRLLGYDPDAVHEAIAQRDAELHESQSRTAAAEARAAGDRARLGAARADAETARRRILELERMSGRLAAMVADRDRALRRLRAQLQEAIEREGEGFRAFAVMARDLEMVRRQAGRQATRIRLRALGEAAEVARRIGESAAGEGGADDRLLARIEEAVERIGVEDDWDDGELAERAASNGHAERAAGELFHGLVEVEVGPLSDFSQLVGLEDAASAMGATSEVSVKRFTQGRATLAMRFKHPVELLRELEERAPFDFVVRDTRPDRIVLDLEA